MALAILEPLHGARLQEYADSYERASGYRVPLDYLERCVVYGYHRRGRLVGGVVMSTTAPFRTFQRIPEDARDGVVARVAQGDTVELTCVWLDRSLRGGAASALFWLGLFLETGRHGVGSVIFGTESPRLHELYLCGRPEILYDGPVMVDGIPRHGWIFSSPVAHRWPALARMTLYKTIRDLQRKVRRRPGAVGGGRHVGAAGSADLRPEGQLEAGATP